MNLSDFAKSGSSSALRLFKIAFLTLGGFIAVVVGIVLILSKDSALALIGTMLVALVVIGTVRTVMRSYRTVHGVAGDETMVCETCGAFPTLELKIVPRRLEAALWGGVGAVMFLGAYATGVMGVPNLKPVFGVAGIVCLTLAGKAFDGGTEHCPTCNGQRVARSTSDAGRRYLADLRHAKAGHRNS